MVAKKTTGAKVKVGKLKLNKETVKDLTGSEAKKIKGGIGKTAAGSPAPSATACDTCGCIKGFK
jgi:hypothetical protein